jgi:hypothetical protein
MQTKQQPMGWAGALLLACLVFFSCGSGADPWGTLSIALPGSPGTGRGAVSEPFTATLSYDITLSGPGLPLTHRARPGDAVSFTLVPGQWTVSVRVLNAAAEDIGGAEGAALVEAGKDSALRLPLAVDTDRKDIKAFGISSPAAVAGTIDEDLRSIVVAAPAGTDLRAAVFWATHTGVSIRPAPGETIDCSGGPVIFTVTAEDGSAKDYTLRFAAAPPRLTAKDIQAFIITSPEPLFGTITELDETAGTIHFTVPHGTDLNVPLPYIVSHTGLSISPAALGSLSFSGQRQFTVTAEDGSAKVYTVTVTAEEPVNPPSGAARISRFVITSLTPELEGDIDEAAGLIRITVPYGTALSGMAFSAVLSPGAALEPAPGTPLDFSGGPKTLTVTAEDGTSKRIYTVMAARESGIDFDWIP